MTDSLIVVASVDASTVEKNGVSDGIW
jgi:hypothetical protein